MKSITAKSPGKCILFGEHAVVYGFPAIAIAISLNSKCTIEKIDQNNIQLVLVNYNKIFNFSSIENLITEFPPQFQNISYCLKLFKDRFNISLKGNKIILSSDIFPEAGLGSSASVAVALISAFNNFFDLSLNKQKISNLAYEVEKVVHGTPSGIDNTICTYGNIIFFQAGQFHNINISNGINILITYTNIKHNTKEAINRVRDLKQKKPIYVNLIFEKIGTYTELAELELINGNLIELGHFMDLNQKQLTNLNLSNKVISEIIEISKQNGALGSKLTGAGLGGCVISLGSKENLQKISLLLSKKGYKSILTNIDKEGVIIE
jgi:mevalonate kinase